MVLLLPTVVPEGETTGTPLRTLTLDIVAALAAGWTIATQPWDRERLRAALGHPVLLAALAFLAWVAASLIWSEFPQYSRYELLRHGVGVLLFFGIAHGLGERQVGAVAVTLVVAAALGGGVGLVTSTRQ
ncbi:MAG: hypothetical protein FJX77_15220, partial [Armatimonadetes bacterium]|nr:hypothetical protein [Armatimonadota bacterium]